MFSIFTAKPVDELPAINGWTNVERQLKIDIDKTVEYYHGTNGVVDNAHPLVGLIEKFDVDTNLELVQYARHIVGKIPRLSSILGFATNSGKPDMIADFFKDTEACVIVTDKGLSDTNDWHNMKPLRILRHEETVVQPFHPIEAQVSGSPVVVELDILGLMLQYRAWELENLKNGISGVPVANFIYTYVMTNVITNFINLSLVNLYLSEDADIDRIEDNSPLVISDHTREIRNIVNDVRDDMLIHREHYNVMLTGLPVVGGTAATELFSQVPFINTYNMEAHYIARAEYFMRIMEAYGDDVKKPNSDFINDFDLTRRRVISSNVIGNMTKAFDMKLSKEYEGR